MSKLMGLLQPRLDTDQAWAAVILCCPVCGQDYQHHGDVIEFRREREDGATVALRNGEASFEAIENPSSRRDAIRIEFDGECGHRWWLDIVQHKGKTYMYWRVAGSVLKSMPYGEYLETPHWHAVRQRALVAAKHRCQLCNSSDRLEVHHRTYERRGEELPIDLTVLCATCHSRFHGKERPPATALRDRIRGVNHTEAR